MRSRSRALPIRFRRFVGLGVDDSAWDYSTFSKNRDRLLAGEVAAKFLSAVLGQPPVERWAGIAGLVQLLIL